MKRSIFILALLALSPMSVFAGNGGRGGVPDAITEDAYVRYITGNALRSSVANYLNTLKIDQITDPVDADVRRTFEKITANGLLAKDISIQGTYVAGLQSCRDQESNSSSADKANSEVRAWTHTGVVGKPNIGGRICYDVKGLVADHMARGLDLHQAALELTALTYHEYVHHFQTETNNPASIKAQEARANAVAGYVLRSAEFVPLLQWSSPSDKACKANCFGDVLKPWRDVFNKAQPLDVNSLPESVELVQKGGYSETNEASEIGFQKTGVFVKAYASSIPADHMRGFGTTAMFSADQAGIPLQQIGNDFVTLEVYSWGSRRTTFRQMGTLIIVKFEECSDLKKGFVVYRYATADLVKDVTHTWSAKDVTGG